MRLTEDNIKTLVKQSRSEALAYSEALQDEHKVHITGDGYQKAITQIIGYENVEQFKQKKLLTKPFTRPLLKYIIDAQGRWKTAQGTSKVYRFQNDDDKKKAKAFKTDVLSQVWKGKDMENFIGKFLSPAIYTEFNGFFIVDKPKVVVDEAGQQFEIKDGKSTAVEKDAEPLPYIIFKPISEIHNFSVTGDKVDWIVYKLPNIETDGKSVQRYRVIDTVASYTITVEGSQNVTGMDEPLEHNVGVTPVVPVSSINKELGVDEVRTSPIDALIPLLDYYLNQYAEHVVSCLLHAHPIYYQVGQKCTYSNGEATCEEGQLSWEGSKGEHISATCNSCQGTGHNIHKDASTVIVLPAKTEAGDAFSITNVAGYVTPPNETLGSQIDRLDRIKKEILEAATGQISAENLSTKTATETILNQKPLEDIISEVIDVVEGVETQLTDIIGRMWAPDEYEKSVILRGRKLNLRDENLILEEISKAKENGSSYYYIKTLNEELIFSRFARSQDDLHRNLAAATLEPFIGFTFDEVEASANATTEQKYIKQNFVDYLQRAEMELGNTLLGIRAGKVTLDKFAEKLTQYATEDIAAAAPLVEPINPNDDN